MTGDDIRNARAKLGELWGLGRPLHMSELGRALRLRGADPGASVRDIETGKTAISGPVSIVIEAFLDGYHPRHLGQVLPASHLV